MKSKRLAYYFLPHHETHEKAHLLSWHFLIIYILIFLLVRVGIDLVNLYRPGVLGVNSSISAGDIIEKVNQERQKKGLSALKANQNLAAAAKAKAQNMFEEDYWAHFSPSGKDPWGFIRTSGYKFVYAGENLARNFYTADDTVAAWMNSPSHRDNILNPKYEEIGIAIEEGVLQGQKTILIVQMFGAAYQPVAAVPDVGSKGKAVVKEEIPVPVKSTLVAGSQRSIEPAVADPSLLTRITGICLVLLIAFLLAVDFVILRKRGVFRLSSHHFAHLSFLIIVGAALLLIRIGGIL